MCMMFGGRTHKRKIRVLTGSGDLQVENEEDEDPYVSCWFYFVMMNLFGDLDGDLVL